MPSPDRPGSELHRDLGRTVRSFVGQPIPLAPDNLVARPWAGSRLAGWKGLDGVGAPPEGGWGEAFEVAAWPDDPETAAHPSLVPLPEGGSVPLPELLAAGGRELLGAAFVDRFGPGIPLLPKILSVGELLSVQTHPPDQPELYLVLEAAAGASIRLGWRADIDRSRVLLDLDQGLRAQAELQARLGGDPGPAVGRALARGDLPAATRELGERWPAVADLVEELVSTQRRALDRLLEVPVAGGDIIRNREPDGSSALVHALGNPAGHEILLLEIRRPGPTLRAWDHVRFPRRQIDLEAALMAARASATTLEEVRVVPEPIPSRPGAYEIERNPAFSVDLLRLSDGRETPVPLVEVHTLHGIAGCGLVLDAGGRMIARLEQGRSCLVPVGVGPYRMVADGGPATVVVAFLPDGGVGS